MSTPSVSQHTITWKYTGGEVHLAVPDSGPVLLLDLGCPASDRAAGTGGVPLVEIAADGDGHTALSVHADHRNYATSLRLRYAGHEESTVGDDTRQLEIRQTDPDTGLRVTVRLRDEHATGVLRATTAVHNGGPSAVRLRYVSSLPLTGFVGDTARWAALRVHVAHNGWCGEFRWREYDPEQAGLVAIGSPSSHPSRSRYAVTGHGSWSSGDALPAGALSDRLTGRAWAWQIEHNGPWHWEVSDVEPDLAVRLSGPTEQEHQWTALLAPGERFESVPVGVACSAEGLSGALRALTRYRRVIRRPNADNCALPVIFNDYMNALMGDPTTAKLLPLVDAAAEAGAEYFVVDCGWYTDEPGWWSLVGEWREASSRFPRGFGEVVDHIRARGMVPGLWLEPEVVGVRSPMAARYPEEAFFSRDGRRIVENQRYQLDFRHPEVIGYLDATVDRLVGDYGIGYFKFDHNINAGAGTDVASDSPGDGLLGHCRALSAWLDGLFARHPDLVIENCSSGGMRVDYAQLSRMSIQSTSDQQDPVRASAIAAAAASALTPEQAAVWAYPQGDMDPELLSLTMVNALLARIHLSGLLDHVTGDRMALIRSAIDVYKTIRAEIPVALPSWPLGLPGWYDDWLATALTSDSGTLLSVWRRSGTETVAVPFPSLAGSEQAVEVLFPTSAATPTPSTVWNAADGTLTVRLPAAPGARLLRLRPIG